VYRIDHYLTKELVSNIALLRFTNSVFEPLWNNRHIDQVQIILSEKLGIENRGAYYDAHGALSDVVQNHMLELVALIGMEAPAFLTGEQIRDERAKVLEKVECTDAVLGQYEGYCNQPMVRADSSTETFAELCLKINNDRWAGVPFYLKTGKCLDKKETVIHIRFKPVDCLLTQQCPSEPNYLTIQIAPEAIISLSLNTKKLGTADEVVPMKMELCHSCIFGVITPEAYEVIFEEVVRGEQSIAVRFDEIEAAWKIIDAVKARQLPVHLYPQKSAGPHEALAFEETYSIRWRS
jgi:glucose-6-phosphate 1-dehydrogenase